MQPEKPGIYTTEFWMTLAGQIIAFAILLGWIGPDQQEAAVRIATQVVMGAFSLGTAITYIVTRFKLKSSAQELEPPNRDSIDDSNNTGGLLP